MSRLATSCLVVACIIGCDHGKSPCAGEHTDVIETPASDASVQFQIDRCHADSSSCHDLCALMIVRDNLSGVVQTGCTVDFQPDHVEIKYRYGCANEGADGGVKVLPDAEIIIIDAISPPPLDGP